MSITPSLYTLMSDFFYSARIPNQKKKAQNVVHYTAADPPQSRKKKKMKDKKEQRGFEMRAGVKAEMGGCDRIVW